MKEELPAIRGMPVAFLCSSDADLERLLRSSNRLSKGESFVLLLNDARPYIGRVLPAYMNAYIRYREGCMKASSLQMEMLIFVSGEKNLGEAIAKAGAKGSRSFTLVSSGQKLAERFARENGVRIRRRYALRMDCESFAPLLI